jgi:DNA-binding transcriptional regulator YbjK
MAHTASRRAPGDASRARILQAIRDLTAEYHRPPSHREICDRAQVSMGSLTHNLDALADDKKIRRLPGSRGIELIDDDPGNGEVQS